jgi:hypothetical protein
MASLRSRRWALQMGRKVRRVLSIIRPAKLTLLGQLITARRPNLPRGNFLRWRGI